MDSLLAGTLILPKRVHCAGYDVQRRRAFKNGSAQESDEAQAGVSFVVSAISVH
jgi:hypothetical protein